MAINNDNHKKSLKRQMSILIIGLLFMILSQQVQANFIITEVSPRPLNSTLEFIELYLLDYNGENITIKDNFGTGTINSTRFYYNGTVNDYQNETYNGYALITQYPEHFIELIDTDEISCLIIGLSGKIGNGLADSGDEVNVTINNTWRFFNYTNSVRGQSYNNQCDNNDCIISNEYASDAYYLSNETPCTGLINAIFEEETEEVVEEEQEEVIEEDIVDDEIIEDDNSQDEENEETEEIIEEENEEGTEEQEEINDEDQDEENETIEEEEQEEIDEETGNDTEQDEIIEEDNNEEENVCEEIIIETQSHPYKTRIEYKILSNGLEYEYWIEYYNGSIAKKSGISKTNAIKTYTPKKGKSEQEIIYRIIVKYNDICTGNEKILHRYVMFVHPFKEEIVEENNECVPDNIIPTLQIPAKENQNPKIIKSFYTRAQKKADSYNYYYSAANFSENTTLYACSILPVTEPENNKHIFPHNVINKGIPVLLALDNEHKVLDVLVGKKPEFIEEEEIVIIELEENNNTITIEKSDELSNAITSAAIRTVKPEGIVNKENKDNIVLAGMFDKAKPYLLPVVLISAVGIAAFRKIK